ncbi:multidrug effflux MFS transporter [Agrilactobacillus fermenti]|uniref:multidrug effflux MFS transporter n=1 Tax=Agrilactobacillus fermenti TaxID=2586909 RepID=UPI0022A991D6
MIVGKTKRLFLNILLGTLSAFGPLSMDMYLPALPDLQRSLHTSQSLAQLSITTCLLGLAIGQIFVGPISDHYGRRKPLLIGVTLFALTSFAIIGVTQIWTLIGLRFIQGLAGSAGQVLSRSIARDQFSGKPLARFMSVLMSINGVFPVIAPLFGGFVIQFTNWQGIFMILGVIGVLLALSVCFFLPESLPEGKRATSAGRAFREMSQLVFERDFMKYVLTQGFVMGALFAYIAGSSFVFQGIYGISPQTFSLIYAINGIGIVLGSRLVGTLINRYTEETILRYSLYLGVLVTGLLALSLLVVTNMVILMIGLFLMVFGIGSVNTTATSIGMNQEGDKAGGASALLGLAMNAIGGLATPLVGAFGSHSEAPMVLLMFAAELIGLGLYFGLPKRRKLR